ncbi:MAG: PspC domain-containing protein [Parerythrobacter sp.]
MTAPVKMSVSPAGKLWGVCSNLSHATGVDALWIRLAFVAGAIASLGSAAIVYAAIALLAD